MSTVVDIFGDSDDEEKVFGKSDDEGEEDKEFKITSETIEIPQNV